MTVVRNTRQRAAVAAIVGSFDDFRTAQEVYAELRRQGSGVGLTTVYRNLQALADSGEIDVLRKAGGEIAYRRCSTGHHHHLVCRSCGRTVEVGAPEVEAWAARVAAANAFRDVDHELEIFGTCADCG